MLLSRMTSTASIYTAKRWSSLIMFFFSSPLFEYAWTSMEAKFWGRWSLLRLINKIQWSRVLFRRDSTQTLRKIHPWLTNWGSFPSLGAVVVVLIYGSRDWRMVISFPPRSLFPSIVALCQAAFPFQFHSLSFSAPGSRLQPFTYSKTKSIPLYSEYYEDYRKHLMLAL